MKCALGSFHVVNLLVFGWLIHFWSPELGLVSQQTPDLVKTHINYEYT